jgi:hypothetical protein
VGREGDDLAGRVEEIVGSIELVVAIERSAAVAPSADHGLLLRDRDPVPELDQHPDDPHHLERAAVGAPQELVDVSWIVDQRVRGCRP